jgi:hypothetical protein
VSEARPDTAAARAPGDGQPFAGYSEWPRPLGEYGLLVATFGTLFSVVTAAAARRGRLPERLDAADVVLGGVATHKLSRLVTKDKVASPLRAPFTREQGPGAPAEVEERPRGRGLRYVVGELLSCPYCLSQWIAGAMVHGFAFAPRVTRLVSAMMSMVALSDFLQLAYKALTPRR